MKEIKRMTRWRFSPFKWMLAVQVVIFIVSRGAYSFAPDSSIHNRFVHRNRPKEFKIHMSTTDKKSTAKRNSKSTSKAKHKRQDLNDLVKSIGLNPVETKKKTVSSINGTKKKQKMKMVTKKQKQKNPSSSIPLKTQLQYARNGHAVLRSKIPLDTITSLRNDLTLYSNAKELEAWRQKVQVKTNLPNSVIQKKYKTIDQCHQFLRQNNNQANSNENGNESISIPFLQHFNTWRNLDTVREFVTSPLMAEMARTLLDVPSIKLYQDSLFHKRQNDGPTPWHSDARMAPFDTSHMITFWIPLQNIPSEEEGGSGLMFVDKSHGDFALPFWNRVPKGDVGNGEDYDGKTGKVKYEESREYERLDERYSYGSGNDGVSSYMPMERGDCTVHAGWTLHSANGVKSEIDRYALAVTYVDAQAEIREDARMSSGSLGHDEDRKSYEDWINEVRPRSYFEHSLVPIV